MCLPQEGGDVARGRNDVFFIRFPGFALELVPFPLSCFFLGRGIRIEENISTLEDVQLEETIPQELVSRAADGPQK